MADVSTIEISTSAAKNMVPCLETRLQNLEEDRDNLLGQVGCVESEIESIKATLAELKAKLDLVAVPDTASGDRQRLPKGQGEKIIADYLSSLPKGSGKTMQEIADLTGVSFSTVRRTLLHKNDGRFIESDNRWRAK